MDFLTVRGTWVVVIVVASQGVGYPKASQTQLISHDNGSLNLFPPLAILSLV